MARNQVVRRVVPLCLCMALALLSSPSPAPADTLVLKNGSRLKGTVEKTDRGYYSIQKEGSPGRVLIPVDEVKEWIKDSPATENPANPTPKEKTPAGPPPPASPPPLTFDFPEPDPSKKPDSESSKLWLEEAIKNLLTPIEALPKARKALELDPENVDALVVVADIMEAVKKPEIAVEALKRAARILKNKPLSKEKARAVEGRLASIETFMPAFDAIRNRNLEKLEDLARRAKEVENSELLARIGGVKFFLSSLDLPPPPQPAPAAKGPADPPVEKNPQIAQGVPLRLSGCFVEGVHLLMEKGRETEFETISGYRTTTRPTTHAVIVYARLDFSGDDAQSKENPTGTITISYQHRSSADGPWTTVKTTKNVISALSWKEPGNDPTLTTIYKKGILRGREKTFYLWFDKWLKKDRIDEGYNRFLITFTNSSGKKILDGEPLAIRNVDRSQ